MRNLTAMILLALFAAACGSGDPDAASDGDGTVAGATATSSGDADTTASPADEQAPQQSQENNVTLELEDGTVIETSALCMIEPQEVGSQTILFTATGYSDIGFDVTQFDENSFGGAASANLYQTEDFQNYQIFWESDSTAGQLELELDGSTIRGSGLFFEGDDQGDYDPFSDEGVPGTLTVDCG